MDTQTISPIDKARNVIAWADYQDEHFNQRIKSMADFEKLYDYKQANELEFLDKPWYWEEDEEKHTKAINKLLGYNIY